MKMALGASTIHLRPLIFNVAIVSPHNNLKHTVLNYKHKSERCPKNFLLKFNYKGTPSNNVAFHKK